MKPRTMINLAILIAFALLSVGGMEYLAVNIGQGSPFNSDYTVHATFSDANGVPVAADIRASGVVVGRVSGVSHDPSQPGLTVVTMQISDYRAVPVYSNGSVTIRPKTLLGETYVDLTTGSSGGGEQIPSGGFLPQTQASASVSNDQVFNAMNAQARADTQKVLADLNAATTQRAGDIQAILPNLQTVVADLVPVAQVYGKDQAEVDQILVNVNTILQTTADEHQQLAALLHNGNLALGAVAQRDQALIATMQEAANVSTEINDAAAPTIAAQRQALQQLAPSLKSVNQLLAEIEGPQAACGGRPCGIDEIFSGTFTGNINYPNDQLTVTSTSGNTVTNEWASMFSQNSALNIVLSFHCDTLSQMLGEVVNGIPAADQQLAQQTCQQLNGHTGASLPIASSGASTQTRDAALLLGGGA